MATYKRQQLPELLKAIEKGETGQVFLIFGERYLCRQAAEQIVQSLLPDEKQRSACLVAVDGDREEPGKTLNQLRTFSLFGGRRVIWVTDSRLLHSKVVAKTIWDKAARYYRDNDLEAAGRYLSQVLEIGAMKGEDLEELPDSAWKEKLGFNRPQEDLGWVREVLEKRGGSEGENAARESGDITELYTRAFDEGLPGGNTLVLVADTADKRKKFYKYIAEHGTVVDLAVDPGTNKAAVDSRNEVLTDIVRRTLTGFGKKIEPRAMEILLERVGFHPVAAALESEKLALYTDERERITVDDINAVIGRTREEAVYELSETFSDRNLAGTLAITGRLLENGLHPLVIIAALRNHIKKMLVVASMRDLENPSYSPGVSFPAFKSGYLERLKKEWPDWPKDLPGHPYALYMMFKKVEKFETAALKEFLAGLLEAEYRMKGSGLPEKIVLENMFFSMLDRSGSSRGKARLDRNRPVSRD